MPSDPPARPAAQPDDGVYRRLIEVAPDAMVGVDESGLIVLVNHQAEALFGYRREDLIGQLMEVLVPVGARHLHPGHRASYLRNPELRPMGLGLQLAARRSDGSEFPAEISLGAIETTHGWIISAAIRDVSERLAAERERQLLARQAEAERAERKVLQSQRLESLGQLAGGIAHDFNNLLAVISNHAAFVREEVERAEVADLAGAGAGGASVATPSADGRSVWSTARRDIGQIERAADAAVRLTRQLLTFARRDVVRPQAIDLNAIVEETVDLLHRTLGEDVHLEVLTGPALPSITADPGQIQQVLVNLAINSRLAMPSGGTLTISTEVDRAGRTVSLTVSDTGIGMDETTLARAFEPFFTTRDHDHGSGLGLATVYGIVTQAGGSAALASSPGSGTTFSAHFPADTGRPTALPVSVERPTVDATGTVLVVDDEPGIREVAERILGRHGWTVLSAGGADEAVHTARHHPEIDLLLSDVIMPRTNGPEMAARLRAVLPRLRVVFISGYIDRATRLRIPDDALMVEKPFSEADLVTAVNRAMFAD